MLGNDRDGVEQRSAIEGPGVRAKCPDRALLRLDQSNQQAQQGRLAGARGAGDRIGAALTDLQVDLVEDRPAFGAIGHPLELE